MIPSKEDILNNTEGEYTVWTKGHQEYAMKCMDIFAKEIAIGFAEWVLYNGYRQSMYNGQWMIPHRETPEISSEQLYNQYLNTLIQ